MATQINLAEAWSPPGAARVLVGGIAFDVPRDGEQHHLAVVVENGQRTLYLDGSPTQLADPDPGQARSARP